MTTLYHYFLFLSGGKSRRRRWISQEMVRGRRPSTERGIVHREAGTYERRRRNPPRMHNDITSFRQRQTGCVGCFLDGAVIDRHSPLPLTNCSSWFIH